MRIRLRLETKENAIVPYNYQYYISSMIYNLINDKNFALNLHNKKGYKFFTFSELLIKNRENTKEGIKIKDGFADLFISSPNNDFIKELIKGILNDKIIRIKNIEFTPVEIKLCETPKNFNTFKTLSPIYVFTRENNKIVDLYPNCSKFFENLKKNLIQKYIEYYNKEPKENIEFEILDFKRKRIKIKDCYYRCSHMKFRIKGDENLIKFGYECGFGSKNSLGFGCVEIFNPL